MVSIPFVILRRSGALCALALLAFLPEVAAATQAPRQGRPLTIEDYYRVKTVGSPEISPDGRWRTASNR